MAADKQRRNTSQRRIVLEELRGVVTHPTAAELFTLVRQHLPRISLGTVYRNLEVLHSDGMVLKLELAGAEARFDGNVAPHLHIRCKECDRVRDAGDNPALAEDLSKRDLGGFTFEGHRIELFGTCPDCRDRTSH